MRRASVVFLFVLMLLTPAWADDNPEKLVAAKLAELKAPATGKTEKMMSDVLRRATPGTTFVVVFYNRFPPEKLPAGVAHSTLFAVKMGKVTVIKDQKDLDAAFVEAAGKCSSEAQKKDAVTAYATLAVQLNRDGFFVFKQDDKATKVSGNTATAQMTAYKGGSGDLTVTLTYDKTGKVTKAEQMNKLEAGVRPK